MVINNDMGGYGGDMVGYGGDVGVGGILGWGGGGEHYLATRSSS